MIRLTETGVWRLVFLSSCFLFFFSLFTISFSLSLTAGQVISRNGFLTPILLLTCPT